MSFKACNKATDSRGRVWFHCLLCNRPFETARGVSQHVKHCKWKQYDTAAEIMHRKSTSEAQCDGETHHSDDFDYQDNIDDVSVESPPDPRVIHIPDNDDETGISLLPEMEVYVNLLHLMEQMECPLNAFEKIINWARTSQARSDFDFCNPHLHANTSNRRKFMKKLVSHTGIAHYQCNPPISVPQLGSKNEPNYAVDVVTFDFESMLNSLLTDPSFTNPENLVMNPDNPFGKYKSPGNQLDEIHSGRWYRDACIQSLYHRSRIGVPVSHHFVY